MAAVAQATTHTHFIYHFQPPEGKVCTIGDNYEFNSRVGESLPRGYYTQAVQNWFVRSSDKDGQNFNGENTMEQSTNWESLIAQRMRPCVALKIEDPVKRNHDIYEKSPRRKAMHKAWAHSPEGKASRRESYRRYAQSEHGKEVKRRNKRASYLRHKDNPQWHEHKLQLQREWRERKKAEKQKENEAA